MNMSMKESDDEMDALFYLTIGEISDFELEKEANDYLFELISSAFKKAQLFEDYDSRTLEFKENCRIIGTTINTLALERNMSTNKALNIAFLEAAFLGLCPGFWPFC